MRRSQPARPSGESTGMAILGCSAVFPSAPIRRRNPRYAVQHRRNTCCPLSTHKPSRRNEKVAPPSRGRASRSVTRAPPSTHDIAAARPARPPPTTITRGASAGVTAGPPPASHPLYERHRP